jgi:hypothetical protein
MFIKKKFIGKASGKLIATMFNSGDTTVTKKISLHNFFKITNNPCESIYEQNINLCYDSFIYHRCSTGVENTEVPLSGIIFVAFVFLLYSYFSNIDSVFEWTPIAESNMCHIAD